MHTRAIWPANLPQLPGFKRRSFRLAPNVITDDAFDLDIEDGKALNHVAHSIWERTHVTLASAPRARFFALRGP